MTSRDINPNQAVGIELLEIVRLCRLPSKRFVANRPYASRPWSPESTINPITRRPYTPEAAWEDIASAVGDGRNVRPTPSDFMSTYALRLPSNRRRQIYVELRLGRRAVIGQSFCYLPESSGE